MKHQSADIWLKEQVLNQLHPWKNKAQRRATEKEFEWLFTLIDEAFKKERSPNGGYPNIEGKK